MRHSDRSNRRQLIRSGKSGRVRSGAVLPGVAASNGDRPFAETITVTKNPGDLLGVDYYEIEVFSGGTWNPLPAGAEVGFQRKSWDTATASTGWANFPFTSISGHNVCETASITKRPAG